MKKLMFLLAVASLSTLSFADEVTPRTLSVINQKDIKVFTTTDLPEGTSRNLGPIIFHRTDDKNPLSQSMTDAVGQALNGPVFRVVPTVWWDKAFDGEGKGLGDAAFVSTVIFQGSWSNFLQKNLENAEKSGSELDGRGALTIAAQTIMLGVSLLAGAPVTAVANAGLTGTYGKFTKEDTQWFQTIQIDPDWLNPEPKSVLVMKTCMNRRGKEMTCVQTLAISKTGNFDALKTSVADSVAKSLTQLVKPEPGLSPELELKAKELNQLLVAAKSESVSSK